LYDLTGDDNAHAIGDGNDPSSGSSGDDVARVAFPFGVFCDLGVGAAVVEGSAQALRCSGQRFLPIRKVNARMRVIRERRLKKRHRHGHHYSDAREIGGGGMSLT
jgi:hypothetical protein